MLVKSHNKQATSKIEHRTSNITHLVSHSDSSLEWGAGLWFQAQVGSFGDVRLELGDIAGVGGEFELVQCGVFQ